MEKTVVITGAGGVLCSSFARTLANKGYQVALLGRHLAPLAALAEEIASEGGSAMPVVADVLDMDSLRKAREEIGREWGECRVLINGAGGNHPGASTSSEAFLESDRADPQRTSFFDLDEAAVSSVFDLNLKGTLLATQVFAEGMTKTGGCIINISSMNAFCPLTKIPAYSAAKAAVSNFTQWLAVHFAPCGIRVNAIAPGFFDSAQNHSLLFYDDGTLTPRSQKILEHTPMKRFGRAEELNGTLCWLVDEEASGFVTGIVVPVDGGFSAYSGV